MNNELIYQVDEKKHLIVKHLFNNVEIGTVDGGDIEEILHKVKMYDEEYDNLFNQNELMQEIAKDYEEKDNQITKLTNNWNELEEWLKSYISLLDDPDTFEEQTLEDLKEVLDKMKEIKEGK